jgi:hypothetical protein
VVTGHGCRSIREEILHLRRGGPRRWHPDGAVHVVWAVSDSRLTPCRMLPALGRVVTVSESAHG